VWPILYNGAGRQPLYLKIFLPERITNATSTHRTFEYLVCIVFLLPLLTPAVRSDKFGQLFVVRPVTKTNKPPHLQLPLNLNLLPSTEPIDTAATQPRNASDAHKLVPPILYFTTSKSTRIRSTFHFARLADKPLSIELSKFSWPSFAVQFKKSWPY
jgi:hypothetical protein